MKREDIQIRDPFILADDATKTYYLYGTTDKNCWGDTAHGFDCYKSHDLENWEGPSEAFVPPTGFWATKHFWAPEVYAYNGKYYMFASFKADGVCRGTQILSADNPQGPFVPVSDKPVTPADWECLDGTLYIDNDGEPWIIFCHEWTQAVDGEMIAMRLTHDFSSTIGERIKLFNASSAPWTTGSVHNMDGEEKRVYVTDGPFIYKTKDSQLLMIWSSGSKNGYAVGTARSVSGKIDGEWIHDEQLLFDGNGGHGMIFKTFDGKMFITLHSPNKTPNERPCFFELEELDGKLCLKNQ